jgi:hypothetical protein
MCEREQVWRELIELQPWFGLTAVEWCAGANVLVASFYRWKKLLAEPQGARHAANNVSFTDRLYFWEPVYCYRNVSRVASGRLKQPFLNRSNDGVAKPGRVREPDFSNESSLLTLSKKFAGTPAYLPGFTC